MGLACGETPVVQSPEPESPVVAVPVVVEEAPVAVPVEPVAEGLPLHLLAHRYGPMRLLPGAGEDMAVIAAPVFARLAADGALVREPGWIRELGASTVAADLLVLTFEGSAPAWLVSESRMLRTSDEHLVYRWEADRWRRIRNESGAVSWHYAGAAAWRDGHTLALRVAAPNPDAGFLDDEVEFPEARMQRLLIERQVARQPTRFEVLGGAKVAGPLPKIPKGLALDTFIANASGEVFAAGRGDRGAWVVAWWANGATSPVVAALPGLGETARDIKLVFGSDPGHVFAYGRADNREKAPYLAEFADGRWTRLASAPDAAIRSLAQRSDGVLWAVHADCCGVDGALWRRDGSVWTKVELAPVRIADDAHDHVREDTYGRKRVNGSPEAAAHAWSVAPDQVFVRGADDLWLVGRIDEPGLDSEAHDVERSGRYVVLRSRPAPRVLRLPGPDDLTAEMSEWTAPKAWRPGMDVGFDTPWGEHHARACERTFVALAAASVGEEARLTELVPRLAAGRQLVVELVEASIRGGLQLGVVIDVPEDRQAAVTELVGDLARASPGLQPLVRCHVPAISRFFGPRPSRPVAAGQKLPWLEGL